MKVPNEEIGMTLQTKANVVALIHEHQGEIRRLGVKRLGLFGSFESLSPYIGPHILHEVEYVPLSA